jgi:hypothetical protein
MRFLAGRARFGATGLAARARSKRCALGLVELERAGERFEHQLRDAADLAALQAPVVVGAHAGQGSHFLATKAGHPTLAVGRQAGLLGRDLRPACGEELGDVVGGVHGLRSGPQKVVKATVDRPRCR